MTARDETNRDARLSTLFHRSPRLLVLTLALIVVSGLASLAVLPRAEDPELVGRWAVVRTPFPGASAERVATLVTEPLEDEVREVEEVLLVESLSRTGLSVITIQIDERITDTDPIWSRLRDRIARAALPSGAGTPVLEEMTIVAHTLVAGIVPAEGRDIPPAILSRLARRLEERLLKVPGTESADRFGEGEEEVTVSVDPARLAGLGLTPDDVAGALARADAKGPAGLLRSASGSLSIELTGAIDSLERLRAVPVRTGGAGATITIADVATVTKGLRDPRDSVALVSGREAVLVTARMESSDRVDLWAGRAREVLASFQRDLPEGVELRVLFDQSRYTDARLAGLFQNLGLGALLVILVVLALMGWRQAILVGAALPLSALLVLAGMRALGIPIHQMSVTGLLIALGLLIDNAIVVTDELSEARRAGRPMADAIAHTVSHLGVPLLGSTLTTVLAFMPIAIMPGGAGEFVGSIAISVILALVASLGLSLTVVPALAGLLDRLSPAPAKADAAAPSRLAPLYDRVLRGALARPWTTMTLSALIPVLGFAAGSRLPDQFFPSSDRDQVQVELRLAQHASIAETVRAARRAREVLLAQPGVEEVDFVCGENAPKVYYNLLETTADGPRYAQGIVRLSSSEGSLEVANALQRALDEALPEALAVVRPFEQGPPFQAPIEVRVVGPDTDELRRLGEGLRGELAALEGVTHARTTLASGRPKLRLAVDEERARLVGLDHGAIASQLGAQLEGRTGGALTDGTEELPVRVRIAADARGDLDRLEDLELSLRGPDGTPLWLPLSSLGRFELEPDLGIIARRDGERVTTVQGFLEAGRLAQPVLAAFQDRIARPGLELPPGYRLEVGGESAERDKALGNLFASAVILFVLMGATLVMSFRSFRLAGVVTVVAVLAVGLSLLSLFVAGYPLGFMAIVGTMGLIGVAINDTIVVLSAVRADERARGGDPAHVAGVVKRSTRHVLATTLTTAFGFAPLVLAGGSFWPPVAVTIAGGVLGSTLLALSFAPAAYVLLERTARRVERGELAACPRARRRDRRAARPAAAMPVAG